MSAVSRELMLDSSVDKLSDDELEIVSHALLNALADSLHMADKIRLRLQLVESDRFVRKLRSTPRSKRNAP